MAEVLGPNLVDMFAVRTAATRENRYCTPQVKKRALAAGEEDECIQRQEIQFQKPLLHDADQPYLYSFRFRMPGEVEDKVNSIRWVTAQWKEEPVSESYAKESERIGGRARSWLSGSTTACSMSRSRTNIAAAWSRRRVRQAVTR
jgi:hypothetical protein